MAAGAIYKKSARISVGGTALPIKRVATTRPSGNTKLSGRPWSRASSRTCSSRACVPSCHTYTALVVDTVGARPSSSYMRECWVLRRRKARWYRRGVRRVSGGRSARAWMWGQGRRVGVGSRTSASTRRRLSGSGVGQANVGIGVRVATQSQRRLACESKKMYHVRWRPTPWRWRS